MDVMMPLRIILCLAIGYYLQPHEEQKKSVYEKYLYRVVTDKNGLQTRKLESITTYDTKGNVIKEALCIPDSTSLSYGRCKSYSESLGKPNSAISDQYHFYYASWHLTKIISFMCDTVPMQKQFFSYKLNALDQIIEKKEVVFLYKRHESELKELGAIGDSVMISMHTTKYGYNKKGNKVEEICLNFYPKDSYTTFDTITYRYNKKELLKEYEKKQSGMSTDFEKETYKYGRGGELIEVIRSTFNTSWERPSVTKLGYEYDSKGRLIREVLDGGLTVITIAYEYNSNNDVIRTEESDSYMTKINEVEYKYY